MLSPNWDVGQAMMMRSEYSDSISGKELPLSIYDSVVRSLFADQKSLILGMVSMVAAPLVLLTKTGDQGQVVFSILFFTLGLIRLAVGHRFTHTTAGLLTRTELQTWEARYGIAGSIYVAAIGAWVFYGFALSSDAFVHMLSLSLLLCYLVGIVGRNFSSDKVVWQQATAAGIPIILSLTLFGTGYHTVLAAFLLPFLLAILAISARLKKMLIGAVISEREQRIIAARFNVALKHIAHGVVMFDRDATIVVANERFETLMEAGDEKIIGKNIAEIPFAGNIYCEAEQTGNTLQEEIQASLNSNRRRRFSYSANNATIEVDFYPMPKGGVVFLRDITEQVASEEAIKKLASFDPLTNLPNRRSFIQNMERLTDDSGKLMKAAMFFVDLDKFKEVNDSLGHAVGDRMLVIVADRLKSALPDSSMICRFGGDEFVIVVPGMNEEHECETFADRIIAEISIPIIIDQLEIRTGATVGISMSPKNGTDADQLLQTSDAALYAAKSIGRGSYSFYTESLGEAIEERRQLETDLRAALENEDLMLYFQPLVNIQKKRITKIGRAHV